MIQLDSYTARVIEFGADRDLVDRFREVIESKENLTLESFGYNNVQPVPVAEAFACILCVSDERSYAAAQEVLQNATVCHTSVIVVFEELTAKQVLELLRNGAIECLPRPLNLTRLSLLLDMLAAPKQVAANQGARSAEPPAFVGGLDHKVADQLRAVAPLDTTVLITGETGVGKTRLSHLIHSMSPRQDRPFLAVNCGAISESLLDSELFGHMRGAFTGADRDHTGKLAQCKDGTLLLDEIDTLSPAAQVKLLQVTEERIFQPVGSTKFYPLRARLIVASNRPLREEVAAGRFRADLFYRLNVMSFHLAPLRERRNEISELVQGFITEFSSHHKISVPTISVEAMAACEMYSWPGNVRELRNVIERAVILSGGETIQRSSLPSEMAAYEIGRNMTRISALENEKENKLAHARGNAERAELLQALEQNKNNRTKTAAYLGISRVALYKRLRKFQIM